MPAERVAMRDVRVIIRLKYLSSLTTSEIARRLGLARSTVRETLSRFESSDLIWPFPVPMASDASKRRRNAPLNEPAPSAQEERG